MLDLGYLRFHSLPFFFAFSILTTFAYDGGTSGGPGNPTSFKGTASAFNSDNQTTNTGYGYDGNGNPTTYKNAAYTFDPENRLARVGATKVGTNNFYDGDGHLVMSSSITNRLALNSQELYRLYDGEQPVGFYPTASNAKPTAQPPATTDTYGPDGLVSACSPSSAASTFYTFDERGNVAQRLSRTAAVLSSDLYDAYGTQTTTATTADSVGFGGQFGYYTDYNIGLVLCTHRYYDPSTGRWLTRDPMGYKGGINLYGYVGNDPGNRIDPSGYEGEASGAIGGGIINALKGEPTTSAGGIVGCYQEGVAIKGELGLMNEPDPSVTGILTDGIGGILTGTAGAFGGIAAIGTGGLAIGAIGGLLLAGGIVAVAVGVIAVGYGIYNYTHPPEEDKTASCCFCCSVQSMG